MEQRLLDALKHNTADYADIRICLEESLGLGYRGREAEQAWAAAGRGGIVRACTRGGWGIVRFDSLDDLDERVREACRCAALVGHEKTELAPVAPTRVDARATLARDFRGVSLDEKIELVQAYNAIIMGSSPQIHSSWVSYGEQFRTVHFASTDGTRFVEERPKVTLGFGAVARDGALVQRAHDSIASTRDYSVLLDLEERVRETAERAAALLRAPKCEGGTTDVILDRRLAGLFIHEAFGHLSEADFLYENPRMRELMHLGRDMGARELNVVDDGTLSGLLGTHARDDEGTPPSRVPLITAGVLTSHLHSRETAAKMREAPTGNARACARDHMPIVRMRNTCIENGSLPVRDLFGGVERGIYACDSMGGQTEFEMFTFSAGCGYRIEGGKRGELVRDVVLTGNVFETLRNIDGIADDFRFSDGAGSCGKGGQSPLPVSFGSPHVRIRGVVAGGK